MDKKDINIALDSFLEKADVTETEIYDLLSAMIGVSRNKDSAIQISAAIIDKVNVLDDIISGIINLVNLETKEKLENHGYLEKGKEALDKFKFNSEDDECSEPVEMTGEEVIDLIHDIIGDSESTSNSPRSFADLLKDRSAMEKIKPISMTLDEEECDEATFKTLVGNFLKEQENK